MVRPFLQMHINFLGIEIRIYVFETVWLDNILLSTRVLVVLILVVFRFLGFLGLLVFLAFLSSFLAKC